LPLGIAVGSEGICGAPLGGSEAFGSAFGSSAVPIPEGQVGSVVIEPAVAVQPVPSVLQICDEVDASL
jgi:hypothetical protein